MTSCPGGARSEGRHAHNDSISFLDATSTQENALVTYDKVVMQHVTSVLAGCKGLSSSLHSESAQQLQHTRQVDGSDGQQHTM
eukprot:1639-Chlamydomonas_euryale.AAC.1